MMSFISNAIFWVIGSIFALVCLFFEFISNLISIIFKSILRAISWVFVSFFKLLGAVLLFIVRLPFLFIKFIFRGLVLRLKGRHRRENISFKDNVAMHIADEGVTMAAETVASSVTEKVTEAAVAVVGTALGG